MSAFEIISADEFKSAQASPPARVAVSLPQEHSPSTATGGEDILQKTQALVPVNSVLETDGVDTRIHKGVSVQAPELTWCEWCKDSFIEEYHVTRISHVA